MSGTDIAGRLVRLSGSDRIVADAAADVRDRQAVDSNGEQIGRVEDLLIDDTEDRVRFLQIASGGFLGIGKDHVLVPVEAVEAVGPEQVRISRDRSALGKAPVYDPELTEAPAYYADVYGWWGYSPYWTPGYVPPPYPYGYR